MKIAPEKPPVGLAVALFLALVLWGALQTPPEPVADGGDHPSAVLLDMETNPEGVHRPELGF